MSDQDENKLNTSQESIHTMLSINLNKQIKLTSMADNKAVMIVVICSAITFVNIFLLSSGVSFGDKAVTEILELVLPLEIMLAFSSVSLICALMALKPKIVRTKNKERSALFFHNYYRESIEEYKEEMYEIMKSPDRIYDQILTNMYFGGLVLERKFALLGFAYGLFLLAIVCSVLAFVIATFI